MTGFNPNANKRFREARDARKINESMRSHSPKKRTLNESQRLGNAPSKFRSVNESSRGYGSRKARVSSLNERYNELRIRKRALNCTLSKLTNSLCESDSKLQSMDKRQRYLEKKLSNKKLLESGEYEILNESVIALNEEINTYVDSLFESNPELKKLRQKFEALKSDIAKLKEDAKEEKSDDKSDDSEDGTDFDFENLNIDDIDDDGNVDDKGEDDDNDSDDEDSKDDDKSGDEEIVLASIIIEVNDVDSVIEELKEYDIPEDAIKIVEKSEDSDEGKIKVDADYVTELGEYCRVKGWDLEDALGGKIVKDDADSDKDSDEDDYTSLDPDDISDDDIFGPEEGEESDEDSDEEDSDEDDEKEDDKKSKKK